MKQKKENSVALLLHWAGEQKFWLFLAILLSMCSGLCIIIPYIGIYRLMDATFNSACTKELVVQTVAMIAAAVTLRFVLFGCSGVAAHKGAYGALFKVRCMVAEHMARAPLGALNERRTGDIKTVLNEDIEKLELFLAHNLPDLVCYLVGPVVIFIYLITVATVYKGNIIKNLIMDCQSYTKYRPNETTGGIFVSWRRKEELPTGA